MFETSCVHVRAAGIRFQPIRSRAEGCSRPHHCAGQRPAHPARSSSERPEHTEHDCALPLIPPAPFSHTGRRGRLGVLKFEMGDGAQGLAENPAAGSGDALGARASGAHRAGCPRARLPLIPPAPFSHTGRRGSLGVLKFEMGNGAQGLAENPAAGSGDALGCLLYTSPSPRDS